MQIPRLHTNLLTQKLWGRGPVVSTSSISSPGGSEAHSSLAQAGGSVPLWRLAFTFPASESPGMCRVDGIWHVVGTQSFAGKGRW